MKRLFKISLLVLLLVGSLSLYLVLWAPNTFEREQIITVSKGQTFKQIADSLKAHGVIRSRILFDLAGRLLGHTTLMQVGKYTFKPGLSNKAILEDLRYGRSIVGINVVIPEGIRATRQAGIFKQELGIDSARFVSLVLDKEFSAGLGVDAGNLEGFLMPGTYQFYWQTDEEEIVGTLVGEFWKFCTDTLRASVERKGWTLPQVLTMASIIEWETAIDSERTIISGVYHNRLQRGMRLQADPTLQYVIEGGHRRVRKSDLEFDSPYNTYRYAGLPPGPINNPGRASILAALYPAQHKYFYFVATGMGGHAFTKDFAGHLKAARAYYKLRAKRDLARTQARQQAAPKN